MSNLLVLFFQAVNAERDRDVQRWALLKNARDVRQNALLNLAVRHQINRFQTIVRVKGANDFRQVFARERLAARYDEHAKIAAQSL